MTELLLYMSYMSEVVSKEHYQRRTHKWRSPSAKLWKNFVPGFILAHIFRTTLEPATYFATHVLQLQRRPLFVICSTVPLLLLYYQRCAMQFLLESRYQAAHISGSCDVPLARSHRHPASLRIIAEHIEFLVDVHARK